MGGSVSEWNELSGRESRVCTNRFRVLRLAQASVLLLVKLVSIFSFVCGHDFAYLPIKKSERKNEPHLWRVGKRVERAFREGVASSSAQTAFEYFASRKYLSMALLVRYLVSLVKGSTANSEPEVKPEPGSMC